MGQYELREVQHGQVQGVGAIPSTDMGWAGNRLRAALRRRTSGSGWPWLSLKGRAMLCTAVGRCCQGVRNHISLISNLYDTALIINGERHQLKFSCHQSAINSIILFEHVAFIQCS